MRSNISKNQNKARKNDLVQKMDRVSRHLGSLCCLKARLRLLCDKFSTAQQPGPRFKKA